MKAKQVLIFFLGVFAALGVLWLVFPADGIAAGPLTIRYSSYQRSLADAKMARVNVDSVLRTLDSRFVMEQDTLAFYRKFFFENPDRIYLPENDLYFFDPLFEEMEQASRQSRPLRILHYGDSQIEMDRISQDLREGLLDAVVIDTEAGDLRENDEDKDDDEGKVADIAEDRPGTVSTVLGFVAPLEQFRVHA